MCVLILHHRPGEPEPILLGANRDEHYDRPSGPPARDPTGRILAPVDLQAGGTWLGVNGDGLTVAITNRAGEAFDSTRTTRGTLCTEALEATTATEAAGRVETALRAAPRNGFNLLLADPGAALAVTGGTTTTIHELAPGTHVLTNRHELNAFDIGTRRLPDDADAAFEALRHLCRDHADRGGYRICKHGIQGGTVSSALIRVTRAGKARFWFAEGPPCRHPWIECEDALALRAARV